MAHMTCKCGNRMSNSLFPNTLEGTLTGDYECKGRDVWECKECGILHIEVDDPEVKGCHIYKRYIPENGKFEGLFSVGSSNEYTEFYKEIFDRHFDHIQKMNRFDRDTEELNFLKSLSELISAFKTSEVVQDIDSRIKILKTR